jgi:hypothetical protein
MTLFRLAAAALVLLAHVVPCSAQQEQIAQAVARVRRTASGAGLGERAAVLETRLADVEAEARAGRPLFALVRLGGPWTEADAFAYANRTAAATATREAFEREWQRVGGEIAARERRLDARDARTSPAAVRALAQALRYQSGPFYESARLYGLNTTFKDGLLYAGLASANVDFAAFCRELPFPASKPAPRIPPLEAEVSRLEALVVRGYQAAEDKDRRRYLELNSSLKLAGELDRKGWREGALYKVLGAVRDLGLLAARPDAAPDAGALRERSRRMAARLAGDPADHTIAQLFLEMADSALAAETPRVADAAVVLDEVLPRYFELIGEQRP